jgi:pyrimidine operon attenuation protein/uracil phosphoribosyltransferase
MSTSAAAPSPQPARVVLAEADIDRALTRIAHEILEANKGSKDLVLLGIPRRGYPLASRLAAKIAATDPGVKAEDITGQLDVTMFRDDLKRQPTRAPLPTQLPLPASTTKSWCSSTTCSTRAGPSVPPSTPS